MSQQWPHQSEVVAFYGNPQGQNGGPSVAWERANLVLVPTPWRLVTSWNGAPVRGVRVHRKCSDSLRQIFSDIWTASGQNQQKIQEWGMHLFGGGYNFRLMKDGRRLSMHSWGCAVDFDPTRNGFGDTTPNFANLPAVLKAFSDEGWTWGGTWTKPDGMHWQAANI
jgi:hypothetical protein